MKRPVTTLNKEFDISVEDALLPVDPSFSPVSGISHPNQSTWKYFGYPSATVCEVSFNFQYRLDFTKYDSSVYEKGQNKRVKMKICFTRI